jgi:hypothetical protein
MHDKFDRPLQDSTLVLIAVWNNARELINAFIDGLAATAFN